ncbi:hypothetical protein RHSP_36175 [Rhizobium freirei PRF 81]|uniref:Uncharacterized protein n=1 Tax=Rhizobium freirei PRF 81 TaxID=363754 RepID=N6V3U6_9HYPH|nr:hypothetical protein RHSP_36175 [Rhizobium freirei PRF 81]
MKFRETDIAQAWIQRQVGRIAGKARARNSILYDVESLHHHAGHAEFRGRRIVATLMIAVGRADIVFNHGGPAVEVVMQVYGNHQRLLICAAHGNRNGIDQSAIDQRSSVGAHRLENAGQGVGSAQCRDQRSIGDPYFVTGGQLRSNGDERVLQILDRQAFKMLLHTLGQPHAAEQTAAADGQIKKARDTAHGQRTGEGLQFVEFAGEIAAAHQRTDRRACDHANGYARLVQGAQHANMRPSARRAAAERQRDLDPFGRSWSEKRCGCILRGAQTGRVLAAVKTIQPPIQHLKPPPRPPVPLAKILSLFRFQIVYWLKLAGAFSPIGLLLVDFFRVKMQVFVDHAQHRLSIFQLNSAIEAGTAPSVTRCVVSRDLYFEPDCILITIGTDLLHRLEVSGGFTLLPKFSARAAEIVSRAGLDRQSQRFRVHVRDHQELAVMRIGHDRGDQAAVIEARREIAGVLKLGFIL